MDERLKIGMRRTEQNVPVATWYAPDPGGETLRAKNSCLICCCGLAFFVINVVWAAASGENPWLKLILLMACWW